jgi:hypothetical protein
MHPILIFLLIGVVSRVESKTPTFRSDAADYMEAGFKTLRRRGGSQKDFTRIEISAKPLQMVEDPANIDTHRVSVELKTGVEQQHMFAQCFTWDAQATGCGL